MTPDRESLKKTGDIMGTLMGWLSDTRAGGATTFHNTFNEIKLWPSKGAAGFWWGLYSDGSKDHHATHGGCPVLAGHKWIVNKWMMTFDQWNKFPCDTVPKTRILPPPRSAYF